MTETADKAKGEEISEVKEFGKLCGVAAIYCGIILGISALIIIGIAKVAVGASYLHDCSLEPMVPIYLIVSGVAPSVFSRLGCDNDDASQICGIGCAILGFLFLVIWLICGTIWVYPTFGKLLKYDFTPCTGNMTNCVDGECNKSLIEFAVAMVTIDWIIVLAIVVVLGVFIYKDNKD